MLVGSDFKCETVKDTYSRTRILSVGDLNHSVLHGNALETEKLVYLTLGGSAEENSNVSLSSLTKFWGSIPLFVFLLLLKSENRDRGMSIEF